MRNEVICKELRCKSGWPFSMIKTFVSNQNQVFALIQTNLRLSLLLIYYKILFIIL